MIYNQQNKPSLQYGPNSSWLIERLIPEGENLETTDAIPATGFRNAWDIFHREVRDEDQACTWAMINTETGEKFAEVSF